MFQKIFKYLRCLLIMEHEKKRRYLVQVSLREPIKPRPEENNHEAVMEWLCECLGLSDERDDIAKEIFKELVRASHQRAGVSTRELKDKTHVTQGAVVYHMNVFIRSGIVIRQGRMYYLRAQTLDDTLSELEEYMIRRMNRLRELAKKLEGSF